MKTTRLILPLMAMLAGAFPNRLPAENWPQWRGPFFNGSTTETNLPSTWSKTENVLWATPLPGWSHATPIIWDDTVFVSSPDDDRNLLLLCLDRATGKIRWQKQVGVGDRVMGRNNMTSPSPVTDGKTVFVMYGTGDLAAFDFSGKQLWHRQLAKEYGQFYYQWLYGSSPMLYSNRLYVQVLQNCEHPEETTPNTSHRQSFVLCVDPATGTNIWRHIRPTDAEFESQEAYSTPMPCMCPDGLQIVVAGGNYLTGYDPNSGQELWRGAGLLNPKHARDGRLVPSPLVADGMVIICGPKGNPLLGFHACGKGDITTSGLAWSYQAVPTDCTTPLFYEGNLYELNGDKQMMACMDAKTGKVHWTHPLGNREIYRASPTGADGKIYCMSEDATVVVMSAADGSVLSKIDMGEGLCHASIAASHGCLFIRTAYKLYCISKK